MTSAHARLLALACLLSCLATRADAQRPAPQGDDRAVERMLYRLEDDWAQAVVRRDARALEPMVAARWVYTDESGVMDRAAGIRAFMTGTDTVRRASNSQMRAIVYPGVAIVIGILQTSGRSPAGPFMRRYRYTDTWALIDGRWQCIASQDYLLPERRRAR